MTAMSGRVDAPDRSGAPPLVGGAPPARGERTANPLPTLPDQPAVQITPKPATPEPSERRAGRTNPAYGESLSAPGRDGAVMSSSPPATSSSAPASDST